MIDDPTRIQHIRECVSRILRWTTGGKDEFHSNEMMQRAVVHELQVIGEAAKALSPDFRARHPRIPWKSMAGLRDVLVHDYDTIDAEEVWLVVQNDIPSLERELDKLRNL
jgi:uncharacterized protein with HEPN domain